MDDERYCQNRPFSSKDCTNKDTGVSEKIANYCLLSVSFTQTSLSMEMYNTEELKPEKCRGINPCHDQNLSSKTISRDYTYWREKTYFVIGGIVAIIIIFMNLLLINFTLWSIHRGNQPTMIPLKSCSLNTSWDRLYEEFRVNRALSTAVTRYNSCGQLWDDTSQLELIGSGWSKVVYSGQYKGREVAIKTINFEGPDMLSCRENQSLLQCYHQLAVKMSREIFLLIHLNSSYTLKVLTYCLPSQLSDDAGHIQRENIISMVVEKGEPVNLMNILHNPWERRLKMARDLSDLLVELSTSHLGPLEVLDLRREQFVETPRGLVLSDADDVTAASKLCSSHQDCQELINSSQKEQLFCVMGECIFNAECSNSLKSATHLLMPLLSGAPYGLSHLSEQLVEDYYRCRFRVEVLRDRMNRLVDDYRTLKRSNHLVTQHILQSKLVLE